MKHLYRTIVDLAEASGAIELMRAKLEEFLDKWPERDELLQRFTLLPEKHRRNIVEKLALQLAMHQLERDELVAFIRVELSRAEREVGRG